MIRRSLDRRPREILHALLLLWLVFLFDWVLFPVEFEWFGLVPRNPFGLGGILAMPLVHVSVGHLLANTAALAVLLPTLARLGGPVWRVVGGVFLLSGVLLWLFGRPLLVHLGAEGLVFGLAGYIILVGAVTRRFRLAGTSLAVVALYGGLLAAGLVPDTLPHLFWDTYLCGVAAGVIVAVARLLRGARF